MAPMAPCPKPLPVVFLAPLDSLKVAAGRRSDIPGDYFVACNEGAVMDAPNYLPLGGHRYQELGEWRGRFEVGSTGFTLRDGA